MPNTKSAERRVRNSARKQQRNHSVKSELKSLEKRYLGILSNGKQEDALVSYRSVCSALDKAAKAGVIHRTMANRKKSRLAARLKSPKATQPATAAPAATESAPTPSAS